MRKKLFSFVSDIAELVECTWSAQSRDTRLDAMASTKWAVESVLQLYKKGVETLDAELCLTNWEEDGIKLIVNGPPIKGKAAIALHLKEKFPLMTSCALNYEIDQFIAAHDLVIARGLYTHDDRLKGGSTNHSQGWFITILKRQSDWNWKISCEAIAPNPRV